MRKTALEQGAINVLAELDEWLGNEDGLMIEDVIEWREMLAAALGRPTRDGDPPAVPPVTTPQEPTLSTEEDEIAVSDGVSMAMIEKANELASANAPVTTREDEQLKAIQEKSAVVQRYQEAHRISPRTGPMDESDSIAFLLARLTAVEAANHAMIQIAGEALGTDPSLRSSACVEVLAAWATRLVAERGAVEAERDKLRGFAVEIFDNWPEWGCELDGFELQALGVKFGLLREETMTEPCGDGCSCADGGEFPTQCFRRIGALVWPAASQEEQ